MVGYQRVDDTPQMKAVREGFTNSIIHSDLFLDSGILRIESMMTAYAYGIQEIWNFR